MLRRELLRLGSVATLPFASALLRTSVARADDVKEIRVGWQKAGFLPAVKQRHTFEEAFKAQGIGIKWVQFAFGPPMLEALGKGDIEYANAGDTPAVFAQAAGVDFVYVAGVPGGVNNAVIVPENSPIKSLADLRGKKLGIPKGSSAHNMTLVALEKAGVALSDITPVYLSAAEGMAAFTRGTIDAWGIFDPYLTLAEKLKVGVLASGKNINYFYASKNFVTQHPDLLGKLNDILAKEYQWGAAHHDEVVSLLHESTAVDIEVLRVMIERTDWEMKPMTDEIVATQQGVADRFQKADLITKHIVIKDAVWKWTPASS
jgi:sulfonate transport system substrate-binding protein